MTAKDLSIYDVESRNKSPNYGYYMFRVIGDSASLDKPHLSFYQTSKDGKFKSNRHIAFLNTNNGKNDVVPIPELESKQSFGYEIRSISAFADNVYILVVTPSLQEYSTKSLPVAVDNSLMIKNFVTNDVQVTNVDYIRGDNGFTITDVLKRDFNVPYEDMLYYSTFEIIRPPSENGNALVAVNFSFPSKERKIGSDYRGRIIECNPITGIVKRWNVAGDCKDVQFKSDDDMLYHNSLYSKVNDVLYVFCGNRSISELRTSYIYAVDRDNNWSYIDKTRIVYYNSAVDADGRLWYLKCDGKFQYAPTTVVCYNPRDGKAKAMYTIEAGGEISRLLANP